MLDISFKILFLIVLVFVKEMLVFNEELLIVIAFSLFIYLVFDNVGSLIVNELDEKSQVIQNKFKVYKKIQEKTISYLLNYHAKREVLPKKVRTIARTRTLRTRLINQYHQMHLSKNILSHLEDTLDKFHLNEQIRNSMFQGKYVSKVYQLKKKLAIHEKK